MQIFVDLAAKHVQISQKDIIVKMSSMSFTKQLKKGEKHHKLQLCHLHVCKLGNIPTLVLMFLQNLSPEHHFRDLDINLTSHINSSSRILMDISEDYIPKKQKI